MRILIVSSFLPYPLDSGGHVRLFNIIKELSKNNKITLICEMRPYQTQKDIDVIKQFCEDIYTVERKKQWSITNIKTTALSSYPFLLVGHTLPEMKKKIVEVLASTQFDVIHIETFYVFQNLPKTYLPVVLVEHNIEYKVYEKFAKTSPVFLRPFLFADILKIKNWEEKFWKKATLVVAVSQEEKDEMKNIDAALVPNGVDTQKFTVHNSRSSAKRKEKRVLFIGNFKWIQNQKAVVKILEDIWPKVSSQFTGDSSQPVLWIVGKHIPDAIKAYQAPHILIDENAPEATEKIYQKADVLLAPLEVGGGSSYKIIEAMASGVAVVTTPLGISGINGKEGEHAVVGKNVEELALGVVDVLTHEKKFEKMRENARKFVVNTYNWQVITEELEKVYKDAIEKVQ